MANTIIGRVLATEKNPTTIDNFTFWTDPELILNPFDIVKVQHVNNSFSYGVIEDIAHITDAASFLTNFISSDFGDVNAEENTLRVGMNYVTAKVVCNTENIYIPLQSNAKVMLATAEEINYALGLNDIRNPLVCGYLEMYEGTKGCEKVTLPVNLNSKFIVGPEGAHLNISGISGLASKTSYAMFLLKAIQDSYMKKDPQNEDEDSVAFVLFNVKGKDLLAIDQLNDFSDERNPEQAQKDTFAKYEKLGLAAEPFKNVQYYYPYSIPKTRHWNTYMTPEEVEDNIKKKKAKKYKYIYKYDKENLDLMFANIDDSTQTMESIISYIMSGQGKFNQVSDWQEFLEAVKEKSYSALYSFILLKLLEKTKKSLWRAGENSIASLIRALLIIRFSQGIFVKMKVKPVLVMPSNTLRKTKCMLLILLSSPKISRHMYSAMQSVQSMIYS